MSLLSAVRLVFLCIVCVYFTGAFLVEDGDETLQAAFNAITEMNHKLMQMKTDNDQMKTNNDQLKQRLQAAESTIATLTQTVNSLPRSRMLTDFIWYGDWMLVFRATAGIVTHTYETYVNKGHHDDDPENRVTVPCGCTTVNGSLPCDRHYRSRFLDSWPSAAIDKVRLVLYENGVEKEHVTFSGTGSDYLNWFTHSRVVESSWKDLVATQTFQFFSINGDSDRRFEIMHTYAGCPGDLGWLTVKDVADGCHWGNSNHLPTFIYAPNDREMLFEDPGFRHADVMAIFVKFLPNADLNQMCLG